MIFPAADDDCSSTAAMLFALSIAFANPTRCKPAQLFGFSLALMTESGCRQHIIGPCITGLDSA